MAKDGVAISIPTGPIESLRGVPMAVASVAFQFLLVQLRADPIAAQLAIMLDFNSYWSN